MAADTAAKRLSALNIGNPWRGVNVVPSGTVNNAERAAVLYLYSGIPGGGADVTAPTLSSPTGTATGTTTADGTVSTDEGNGTLYWVITQSATGPSVAQVQAGQDHLGAAADANGSQAVSATGSQAVSGSGLTASTAYYFHYQHRDAATNDSTVVTSAQFTTSTPSSGLPGSMSLLGAGN